MKSKLSKLINLKLLTIITIFLTCGLFILIIGKITEYSHRTSSMKIEITEAKGQCNIIASDIAIGSYLIDQNSDMINSEIEQLAYTYSARVLIINKDFVIVKDNYVFDEGRILVSKDIVRAFNGKTSSSYNIKNGHGTVTVPITSDNNEVIGVINMDLINDNMIQTLTYVNKVSGAIITVSLIIVLIIAIVFAFIISKPINEMEKSVTSLTAGQKNTRLKLSRISEYKQVGNAVNTLLDRLDTIDNSREEFVSNVSHELKTPMTSMKVLADSLLMQDNVPVEIYREFMQDIAEEIDRENNIIGDLLNLVKTDQTGVKLNIETVSINELLELVLKRLKPIAVAKNVAITLESVRPVTAQIDKVKFTLVITNIVENAIKYNVDNGFVRATVNADHKFFYIDVADSGIGIPPECKDQIFDRFYRVDKARSRETGGTGLGLAITKNIVLLHKGTIKYYSKENEGTTFTIRVPLNYVGGTN